MNIHTHFIITALKQRMGQFVVSGLFSLIALSSFSQTANILIDGASVTVAAPAKFPIWLKAGQNLATSTNVVSISVVEYTIATAGAGGNNLLFNQIKTIKLADGTVTVPASTTWKVDAVAYDPAAASAGTISAGTGLTMSAGVISLLNPVAVNLGGSGVATVTGILQGNGTSPFTGITTSAGVAGVLSDETGTGLAVFNNTPTFITPVIGAATGTSLNVTGNVTTNQLTSTVATGTAPFVVASATTVANLGATNTVNTAVTNDNATNGTMYPTWVTANTGNLPQKVSDSKLTFNPSTGTLSSTAFSGNGSALTNVTATTNANLTGPITSVGNATSVASQTGTGSTFVMNTSPTLITPVIGAATGTSLSVSGQLASTVATGTAPLVVSSTTQVANLTSTNTINTGITDDNATAASKYITWVDANTGYNPQKTSSSKLIFNPSTGTLNSTAFSGNGSALTNITATTNANLTGPITSVGNATSVASQTGTGTTFVMNTSPTLVTPVIGAATGTSLSVTGTINSNTGYKFNGAAATNGTFLRGDATNFVPSTLTIPNTIAINNLLYASSANNMTALAPGTTGQVLTTNASGVPTWTSGGTGTVTSVATGGNGITGGTITTSGTISLDYGSSSTGGPRPVGNFGQFQTHSTYTDFNTAPAHWGWNYVQGATNAPNSTSSQWYRQIISLGSEYPARGAGSYSLELAFPRYFANQSGIWMRTVEGGTIGTWVKLDGPPVGSIIAWTNHLSGTPALPDGYVLCSGGTVSDANSPINGQAIPDLNGNVTSTFGGTSGGGRYLRGSATSGTVQADQMADLQIDQSGTNQGAQNTQNDGSTQNYSPWFNNFWDCDSFRWRYISREVRPVSYTVKWIMRIK